MTFIQVGKDYLRLLALGASHHSAYDPQVLTIFGSDKGECGCDEDRASGRDSLYESALIPILYLSSFLMQLSGFPTLTKAPYWRNSILGFSTAV